MCSWPVFDYLAIGPNLYLHYKAFWHPQEPERADSKVSLRPSLLITCEPTNDDLQVDQPLVSGGVREPTMLDGIKEDKYEYTYLLRATDAHLRKTLSA